MKQQLAIQKGTYRHNKTSKLYEVIGTALQTETSDTLVIYRPLYTNEDILYARPYGMFTEEVEINGEMKFRFEKIDD